MRENQYRMQCQNAREEKKSRDKAKHQEKRQRQRVGQDRIKIREVGGVRGGRRTTPT